MDRRGYNVAECGSRRVYEGNPGRITARCRKMSGPICDCGQLLAIQWNYCPNCGISTRTELKPGMKIVPLEDADITLVELRDDGNIGRLTPHCKVHGAMNKVSEAGYWRCITRAYEAGVWLTDEKGKRYTKKISGNNCRAGCIEVRDK